MSLAFNPCPFLGCAEDRASVCSYPSKANVCFAPARRGKRYGGIHRSDQANLCLADYSACPQYQGSLAALSSGTPIGREAPESRRQVLSALRRLWPFRSRGRADDWDAD